MSKIIIHNRSKKLSDAEACHFASRFLDTYSRTVKKLWLSVFGKQVFIQTGENEKSDRIIIEDSRQEELSLPVFPADKSQEDLKL